MNMKYLKLMDYSTGECPELTAPENGHLNISSRGVDSTAVFSCGAGYELQGQSTLICQNTFQWDYGPPSCNISKIV